MRGEGELGTDLRKPSISTQASPFASPGDLPLTPILNDKAVTPQQGACRSVSARPMKAVIVSHLGNWGSSSLQKMLKKCQFPLGRLVKARCLLVPSYKGKGSGIPWLLKINMHLCGPQRNPANFPGLCCSQEPPTLALSVYTCHLNVPAFSRSSTNATSVNVTIEKLFFKIFKYSCNTQVGKKQITPFFQSQQNINRINEKALPLPCFFAKKKMYLLFTEYFLYYQMWQLAQPYKLSGRHFSNTE